MVDKQVVVYSTPTCPNCRRLKNYLGQKNVSYSERNVAADRSAAKEMIKKTGQMGVPVMLIDDEVVVGFNQAQIDKLLGL